MIPRVVLCACVAALALVGTTGAEHCTTYSTSRPEIDTSPVECPLYDGTEPCWGATYLDNDVCQPRCTFSVWYYAEANGIPGLQRGDEVVDDTCHGMIESDQPPLF